MYANHLALMVRGSAPAFTLVERYGEKRVMGTYRTVDTLERGIARYGERELREMEREERRAPKRTGRTQK
jgi:hypothetical protein